MYGVVPVSHAGAFAVLLSCYGLMLHTECSTSRSMYVPFHTIQYHIVLLYYNIYNEEVHHKYIDVNTYCTHSYILII